ncbi:non-ribosomal peptide synthetase [Nostoc sp. 'Peltigera membranacea cyanobiont' N6]|uniref:non-ribosomal peptide synthetase n=1 Tax=Nostoc sp. 'Peltigera membranacea cyanobiont' N6 TaxID=1261031 RepID=UPI000CF30040|nr:non-ribosomal peptide synthetase [Nostoc sp. 'Peltigera membranacea cyanobiont' N6]AVH62573.1 non-ribosomal peptide synthetase [Nostoc sp. 'Peltigera membranacea cyanobiont' N6]
MSYSAETNPLEPNKSVKTGKNIWQAIANILELQNQAPALIPVSRNEHLPLSFSQERLWFLYQLQQDSSTYNVSLAFRLQGLLNISALENSLNEIIQRHETLRTTFLAFQNKPVQVIAPSLKLTLSVVDLQELPEREKETQVLQLVKNEVEQPFDLEQRSLLRSSLVHLDENEYVLLLSVHHIAFDGWSEGILWRELTALYIAFSTDKSSPLPELPIQYADFAVWQRQWLQGQVMDTQLNYWKQQLAGSPPLLELPTDRVRPPIQTNRGGIKHFQLDYHLTQKLKSLSEKSGATLFMTLLTSFVILLSRYSNQQDILIGSPIANRNRSEIESLIGFFVNLLVLRTDVSGNPSFWELLQRVRQVAMEAYSHQDVPFEKVVEALQPERNLCYSPLFQVMFILQNTPPGKLELPGLSLTRIEIENSTAKYDLTLSITENEQGLSGSLEYNSDLFDPATITRMVGHFVTLLEGVVANPEERISQLPLLTKVEQQQLLVEWNDTQADYPFDKCIHQLFEEQVERTPDAVAVVFEDQQLTYDQLNCRANQLAHYLRSLGVKPDTLVGICVERSLEMVVGILGILKAGGAYVPIDPEYPQERLSFMLQDAAVSILLTQHQLLKRLPEHQAQLVCLDAHWPLISQSSQDNLISGVQANNLAYVIYTSGSTGQPKGVALNQLALGNLILWQLQNNPISTGAKTLQFAPISFDVSFQEIFSTWFSGGTLFLIGEDLRLDALALLGFLEEKAIERLFVPFVALQQLAEVAVASASVTSNLREIITAGEQLQITPAISQWLSKLNDCTLHNHYGPSESHVVTTFSLTNSSVNTWPLLPPIGRPIANTQIYILDKYLQLVPVGVPGELYIGGVSLARGYLNLPELTQEKFISNPFEKAAVRLRSLNGGSKLYKTADLARYLPDGNIEYLGRIDNQVKIRGFRIELGEIETVLNQHGDVQVSSVIVREDRPGQKQLVAYIVPQKEVIPTISELRQFLKAKLPDYMVPSTFVILEALPLTPNGKVDRRALPAPDLLSEIADKFVAPRNPIEETLALIWCQVLRLEKVGIYNNFFELGGHSLLATQVISRLPEAFGTLLPLRSLFESPTIAQLSEVILGELLQTGSSLILPAIFPVTTRQDIPLSWAQERLWFLHHLEGESGAYTMPFAMRLVGNLNIKALEQAVGEMVQRHEVLRTRFEIKDDKPVQVIAPDIIITLPVVNLQNVVDPTKQVEQLAIKEAYKPFDLTKDPVLRVKMWQVAADEYVLLIAIHHIAADGWSIGVLNRELSAHYRAITAGSAVQLPELSVQYADFTLWQRQWLTTQVLEPQLSYWKQQLAAAPPLLELPTDRPRPSIQTFRGGIERFQLDGKLTQQLRQLSLESGTTLFMTLLTGFVVLMSRYSGQTDLVIGSPIANRNRKEIEGLIGFFVNTLALRFDLSSELTLKALLEQVQQVTQNAYDHQDLPFEMLVEELQLERNLDRNPLLQVMFALQNAPSNPWDLPGLTVEKMPWGLEAVRFDLEVHFWEIPEGLEGFCYYSSDLFDAATIARMMKHFQNLLAAIVTNLEQPVSQLPLLTAQEKQQLLVEWNATQTDYPSNQCIHDLFAAQAEQTPDAIAVVFGEQKLTYQELNAQANQLAHYLQKLGVKPGVLVGICVERSVSMVVGLLAILKAGAAYVPLDIEYPQERLAFIIEDTQISVLLTTQKLTDVIPQHQARVVYFDTDADAIALESQQTPKTKVKADNLAYVIYTSGSTGKPKGVAVNHRAVNRLVINTNYINMESTDVIAQAANYAFDAATFEIWGGLLNGARLVGVSKELALSPRDFADFLRSQRISVLFLTTALFNQIAQEVPSAFNSLRHLLFGGEAVDPKWVKEVLNNGAPQRLLHVYGPTENTTFTSWYLVQDVPESATTIPIGRPIANTQIYVLDSQLQPVGICVPGELYIGGDGLAREYLNRPELTQEKLIPNPFSSQPGDRLYKTGDKVRYLSDGNIEFLGRIDYQVKIRGFRIELGEIETVLSQHPLLQESVVLVREDTPGDKRLVAYLVPALHRQTLPQQVSQWQSEYVSDWQTLYEQLYSQNQTTDDLTFNIAGWNSSYTKQPIPDQEMQEWVESTVSRIKANFPQHILEIGCGTGLLLSRLAKYSQQYWGTDYSIAAIQHVKQICSTVEGLEDVRLLHQMADNFEGIPQGEFDTVILNSIVQYFPSIEYLLQAIEGAMSTITQQGTIFVGDVRSLPLLEPYHAAVQLSQAAVDKTIEQWQQQVHQSMAAEEELVIDPSFFIALQTRFPQIGWVEIQPKRGYAQNELTQFRYDVTLHVGINVQANTIAWLNWQLDKLSFTQIQNQLLHEQPERLGIRRVPNQRVQQALQIWQWLENPPAVETVSQLRQFLAQQPTAGINPEKFYELGQQLGYTVHLSWWESSQDGCYDVVFCRNSSTQTSNAQEAIAFWDTSAVTTKPWTDYTNNPLYGKLVQKLVPQVREYIQQKLPDYMVPQAFVVLNALPLTPNGKVDRRALPTPDTATRNLSTGFVLPRSPIEAQIAQIWSQVLGVERIGVKDNFFELGGHSLLATQVLSEINSAFELDLSIQMMFESPTVAGIAAYIEVVDLVTQNLSIKEVSSEVVEF